jgi:hypothetical protein
VRTLELQRKGILKTLCPLQDSAVRRIDHDHRLGPSQRVKSSQRCAEKLKYLTRCTSCLILLFFFALNKLMAFHSEWVKSWREQAANVARTNSNLQ